MQRLALTSSCLAAAALCAISCGRFGYPDLCADELGCSTLVAATADSPSVRLGDPSLQPDSIEGPYACPVGTVLTGLFTSFDSYDRLVGFEMNCHSTRYSSTTASLSWDQPATGGSNYGDSWPEYDQLLDCPQDQFVIGFRAFVGAFDADPDDLRVMDRLEVACAPLRAGNGGQFVAAESTYVAQTQAGSWGLKDYNQVQRDIACPDSNVAVQLSTSGDGHADHFDMYCAAVLLQPN